MSDSISVDGEWWRPKLKDTKRVPGHLDFDGESITLKLHDVLGEPTFDSLPFANPDVEDEPVIHGLSLDGEPVTLLNNFYKHWQPNFPGSPIEKHILHADVFANQMVLGAHLESNESAEVSILRVNISNSELWRDKANFQFMSNDRFTSDSWTISKKVPSPLAIDIPEIDTEIQITDSLKKMGGLRVVELHRRTYFEFRPHASGMSLKGLLDISDSMMNLLTLLTGSPCRILEIELDVIEGHPNRTGHSHEPITLHFNARERKDDTLQTWLDILLPCEAVSEELPDILRSWMSCDPAMKQSRALFFSSLYNPSPYMESKFSPIITAVECFSRATDPGLYMDEQKFDEVANELRSLTKKSFPEDLANSWKSRIKYGNEFSLRKRLSSLIDLLDIETQSLFCVSKKEFVDGVINTRNYLTHYSEELKSKALKGKDLYWMTEKLKVFLWILFLTHTGVSEEKIREAMSIRGRFRGHKSVWINVPECYAN